MLKILNEWSIKFSMGFSGWNGLSIQSKKVFIFLAFVIDLNCFSFKPISTGIVFCRTLFLRSVFLGDTLT